MFIHTIVYVFLSILMATAAVASSMPISKAPDERQTADSETEAADKHPQ